SRACREAYRLRRRTRKTPLRRTRKTPLRRTRKTLPQTPGPKTPETLFVRALAGLVAGRVRVPLGPRRRRALRQHLVDRPVADHVDRSGVGNHRVEGSVGEREDLMTGADVEPGGRLRSQV